MKTIRITAIVFVLLAAAFCVPFGSFAEGEGVTFYYDNGEVEVTFDDPGDMTYDKMHHIADKIAGEVSLTPGGDSIMLNPECAAGNHLLGYTTSTNTIHNVYTNAPRCVRNTYQVTYCKRSNCDYSQETLIDSRRIYCH